MSAPTTTTQATLPIEETTSRQAEMWSSVSISLSKIIDDGFNPRQDYGEHDGTFAALVDSIRQRGMLQPPVVRPVSNAVDCEYHIVMGHRRIAAARALGWESVRCTPMEDCEGKPADYTDTERLIDAMEENLQRKDLNCIEVAEGIVRLEKLGKTQEEIAKIIKRSQGRVSNLARLLLLPDGVRTHLRLGTLKQSHGEELLPLLGESFLTGEIEKIADMAAEQGLSPNGLRHVVREKIERATPKTEVLTFGEQTTIDDVTAQTGEYSATNNPAPLPPVVRGEGTSKPAPKDTNGLTRKESDAQFTAAMAPDPDVVPLSERPSPVAESATFPERVRLSDWLEEIGLNWIEAAGRLYDITGPRGDVHKPGMWLRLEPETAQKLMELCDWHLQEHGDIAGSAAGSKLNSVVEVYHSLMLERRTEAEKAKAALASPFPDFEEPGK